VSRKPDPCSAKDHEDLRDKAFERAAQAVEDIARELVHPADAEICADEIRKLKRSDA